FAYLFGIAQSRGPIGIVEYHIKYDELRFTTLERVNSANLHPSARIKSIDQSSQEPSLRRIGRHNSNISRSREILRLHLLPSQPGKLDAYLSRIQVEATQATGLTAAPTMNIRRVCDHERILWQKRHPRWRAALSHFVVIVKAFVSII